MKKLSILFITLLILIFSSANTNSQPEFLLHLFGGFSVPLPQLQGDVAAVPIATTFEKDYGMRLGVNFGADGKYAFDKKGNIRGVISIGYNLFMNPGTYTSTGGNYDYKPTIGIFTASLGAEYAFLPKEKWCPFVGVDFTANFFSGSFKYQPKFPAIPDITLKPETRFGIQFGVGADVSISKMIGVAAGIKYHLANLIGKDSDTAALSQTLPSERPLNDAEYTYRGTTVSAKNISYVQIYAGVTFYFSQHKKSGK